MTKEEELIQKGWKKQSTHTEPQLSEIVQMYKDIDLEVHLEPFNLDEQKGCKECMKISPDLFWTIYTRKKSKDL